jgi:signal transduction histidine kinase
MTASPGRALGLRAQVLLILLGGAVMPLAALGFWLTSSATRAGEQLLQTQLEESADRFAAAVRARWAYRWSDIAFIAENEATLRLLAGELVSREDSTFLAALATGVGSSIPLIELRDTSERVRWSWDASASAAAGRGGGAGQAGLGAEPVDLATLVRIETPVVSSGRRVGTAVTQVALSALIPPDSARPVVPGARVGVRSPRGAEVVVPLTEEAPFPSDSGLVRVGDAEWRLARRDLGEPPLELAIGAPLAPYVAPFAQSSRIGIFALFAVGLAAVVFTVLLTTRATRPLRELAAASDAVAQGRLDQRVAVRGPSEVRHVGAAFNTMTEQLRRTLDELSRRSALAAVGEFATSLSHDVRNALTSIKVDLERADRRGVADPLARTLVSRGLGNVARLEAAVTGALRVARRGHAPPKVLDLRDPVREAADTAGGAFAAVPGTLEVHLPEAPLRVVGDSAALQQLFANLLFNAAQALGPGGSAVATAKEAGDFAEVSIRDGGVGMSGEDLARLSTPFFSTKPSGTGLGLPIARQIAAAHGGDISIESEVGNGTAVRVRIPLLNGSAIASEQSVPARDGHSEGV